MDQPLLGPEDPACLAGLWGAVELPMLSEGQRVGALEEAYSLQRHRRVKSGSTVVVAGLGSSNLE